MTTKERNVWSRRCVWNSWYLSIRKFNNCN